MPDPVSDRNHPANGGCRVREIPAAMSSLIDPLPAPGAAHITNSPPAPAAGRFARTPAKPTGRAVPRTSRSGATLAAVAAAIRTREQLSSRLRRGSDSDAQAPPLASPAVPPASPSPPRNDS
jgi:hypothetical protein